MTIANNMAYAKTFIEDYLRNGCKVYKSIPTKYIIYNSNTREFRSSFSDNLELYEHSVKILSSEDNFTMFISHPIEKEYFFMGMNVSEEKIYDYYDFYDIEKNEIEIVQDYSVFIDCDLELFNITTTRYFVNSRIDSFDIVHFRKENGQ
jgi:hypothetical protein